MSLRHKVEVLSRCATELVRHPRLSVRRLAAMPEVMRASNLASHIDVNLPREGSSGRADNGLNALREYFESNKEGPGVWKWLHYFDIYERHLGKFVGQEVNLVEVGVYSGGSMPMWRAYFGDRCRVHGVDIQPECKAYENSNTTIHIGDQADRGFWQRFRATVPSVDILIDDGGHQPEQQMVTLEEMLGHLRPGGVYICEDVHGISNLFAAFAHSLADGLNACVRSSYPDAELGAVPTPVQTTINSVHLYPFVVVIEKRESALRSLSAPKRGTQWQPFL